MKNTILKYVFAVLAGAGIALAVMASRGIFGEERTVQIMGMMRGLGAPESKAGTRICCGIVTSRKMLNRPMRIPETRLVLILNFIGVYLSTHSVRFCVF